MITVTPKQLNALRAIRDAFPKTGKIPAPGAWRKRTADDIWIRTVSQVVVVGRAEPAKRLWGSDIRPRISWDRLLELSNSRARRDIWRVLREIKARRAGKSIDSCPKTKAIMKNRAFLMTYPDGPKGFLNDVAIMKGGDKVRIDLTKRHLSYIKDKGARDFLMSGFGVIRNSVAIDLRVRAALAHVGIIFPEKLSTSQYEEVEGSLLEQICKPLNITGARLDQLLFQNCDEIKSNSW